MFDLDAGANIGMYTVMVASMGREVVAVDAMADNLAYIRKSLKLGNKEDKVVLVHNWSERSACAALGCWQKSRWPL